MFLTYEPWLQEQHDRSLIPQEEQYSPEDQGFCNLCGEKVSVLTQFADGLCVCEDCLHDYLKARAEGFTMQYIEDNKEDFYLKYWFENLPIQERAAIVREIYGKQRKACVSQGEAGVLILKDFMGMEKDFMLDRDDWEDYVKERLG